MQKHSGVRVLSSVCERKPSIETSEVGFFAMDELPPISTARVTETQIHQFFELLQELPENTYFD